MKTLKEIKDECAIELGYLNFDDIIGSRSVFFIEVVMEVVAKRYAIEVAKETLNNALAVTINHYFVTHDDKPIERHVLGGLINNENNIPELI